MTPRTIHLVSLGCPKNRVDSEVMLGVAERTGYEHVASAEDAAVIVVNTCGFIDTAKRESIDTILEFCTLKQRGSCQKLIVTGCLSQRYPEALAAEMPEVDHFLGSSDMLELASVLAGEGERVRVGDPARWLQRATDPRRISTPGASAYLKLAEGCDRACAFCVIPSIRGKQRSRPPADVLEEARKLADAGVLELNLISQDTVAYGRDLDAGADLASVVEQLAEVPGLRWVRLHYLYPEVLGAPLIRLLAEHPRVLPYVDMPLQHAADGMLRRMRRGHGGRRLRTLVERLRAQVEGLVFRTAFIVGHPGETDEEFEELCEFVSFAEFERVGVFCYSDEEGARSATLGGKVSPRVAEARARRLTAIQRKISRKKLRALVGRELDVLVEGPSEESELVMTGRYYGQAPEIDGCVYLSGAEVAPGQLRRVRVAKSTDYDLLGEVIDDLEPAPAPDPGVAAIARRATDGRRVSLRTVS